MKTAFTIATADYLAHAKTVADSFVEHNPDYKFVIGLLDKVNERFELNDFSPHEVVEVERLNISYFAELYERYNMFELSNALKPFFAEYLYQRSMDITIIIYVDSDMMVFDKFSFVEECLKKNAICLTPHILKTIPKDDLWPDESVFLNAGIYNGGFFAIKKEKESIQFLNWWKEKLRYYCFTHQSIGLFVDQLWLNFVPLFFKKVVIIKHPGYNVAAYNLHERNITSLDKKFQVNEKYPLVLYHYTGYDLDHPDTLSKYQSRFSFNYRTDIKPLYDVYKDQLEQNKFKHFSQLVPFYKHFREKKLSDEEQAKLELERHRAQELIDTVNKAVGPAVEQTVNQAIGPAIDQAIGPAVEQAVEQAVNQAIDQALEPTVKQAVNRAIGPAIDQVLWPAVDQAVENQSLLGIMKRIKKRIIK